MWPVEVPVEAHHQVVVPRAPHCCGHLLRGHCAIQDQIGLTCPWSLRHLRASRAWHAWLPQPWPQEALQHGQQDPRCPPHQTSGGEQQVLLLQGGPRGLEAGHVLRGATRSQDRAYHRQARPPAPLWRGACRVQVLDVRGLEGAEPPQGRLSLHFSHVVQHAPRGRVHIHTRVEASPRQYCRQCYDAAGNHVCTIMKM